MVNFELGQCGGADAGRAARSFSICGAHSEGVGSGNWGTSSHLHLRQRGAFLRIHQ